MARWHSFSVGLILLTSFVFFDCQPLPAAPDAGFTIPENINEVTFKYETYKNLILLPVTINDSVKVNLVLDTGCRNLLLFGKRFEKLFNVEAGHKIQFSGLGEGLPLTGKLALCNKVSIHALLGEKIPVIIVPNKHLFSTRSEVHGVIGYDIFIKFEIEFNAKRQLITFRPASTAALSEGYTRIPLRIEDCKPLIQSKVFFSRPEETNCLLMLDTGSALGLLLRTADAERFDPDVPKQVLGKGLCGNVMGTVTWAQKLILETFEIKALNAGISWSDSHAHGSLGMDVMKNYSIVLNYCKSYAGFKKLPKRSKKQFI